jgi:magnesium chelatase family protein
MQPAEVQAFYKLDKAGSNIMRAASEQMDLSARVYQGVLQLSRTVADLAGEENIQSQHLAVALK